MSELTKKIQLEERISGDWSQAGIVDVFYFVLPPFTCTYNQFKIFQSDLEIKYSIKGMNTSEEFLEKNHICQEFEYVRYRQHRRMKYIYLTLPNDIQQRE